jgi:hypothetical protein
MELTFNKTSNGYTAEYLATTHFNLHIEGGGRAELGKRKGCDFSARRDGNFNRRQR